MTKLLLDARMLSGESVDGWPSIDIYGHDQLTTKPAKAIVEEHAIKHSQRLPVIINLEDPPTPKGQDFYIQIVDWWRSVRPDLRVGFYSLVPNGNWWAPIISYLGNDGPLNEWQQSNAQMMRGRNKGGKFTHRGLGDVVDFVCPSLYMAYVHVDPYGNDHAKMWFDAIAPMCIAEARKFQKQVYPFICPRVHFGNQAGDADKYLGDDLLRRQIAWCIDNADGCIVWDYYLSPEAETVLKKTSEIMREFV